MQKLSKSKIHQHATVFLRTGSRPSNLSGEYLFADSQAIFGSQNLASNLFESSTEDEMDAFLRSAELKVLVDQLQMRKNKRCTLVFTEVRSDITNITMEYGPGLLTTAAISACEFTFKQFLKLPFELVESATHLHRAQLNVHECYLYMPTSFVVTGSVQLSEIFRDRFSSDLYTDSMLPLAMLGPCLNGSAETLST